VLKPWRDRAWDGLLDAFALGGLDERPFPNDGWSGASLSHVDRGDDRFIIKRTSLTQDWIAASTRDDHLREGAIANGRFVLPAPFVSPYLGAAADGAGVAILMPDLSGALLPWDDPDRPDGLAPAIVDRVIDAMATLHGTRLEDETYPGAADTIPWTPLAERLTLLGHPAAERLRAGTLEAGVRAGTRFLEGWEAFDRHAPAAARALIRDLATDPAPLLDALERLPDALLHGDLKLANVALLDARTVALIDWQLVMRAPIAVELGWFLASNSGTLPWTPSETMARYLSVAEGRGNVSIGDRGVQTDMSWIIGLLLRGWRKGLDTDAASTLASGIPAADDLAWWSDRAVEAADRRL